MVLVQWLERGLGQILAPDSNYKPDPESVDTRSSFWSFVAPDPNFTDTDDGTCTSNNATTTPKSKSKKQSPFRRQQQQDNDDDEIRIHENRNILMTPSPGGGSRGGRYNLRSTTKNKLYSNENLDIEDEEEFDDEYEYEDTVDVRVLETARALANCMTSPIAVRKKVDAIFRFCSSSTAINEVNQKKLRKMLKENNDMSIEARCSRMGHLCPDGYTPLMACAHANHIVAAKIVCDIGPIDQILKETNLQGKTAYHIAAENGHVEILTFLQSKYNEIFGINSPPPIDLIGMTPLGVAITSPASKAISNKKVLYEKLFSPTDASIIGSPVPIHQRVTYNRTLSVAYGVSQMPGKRIIMEDSSVASCWNTAAVFAVCDGHSDSGQVSKFVAESFPSKVRQALQSYESNNTQPDWQSICTDICTATDTRLKDSSLTGGSTAVIAIVTSTEIICANVGDCRCILVQKQQQQSDNNDITVIPLSEDHKANTENEIKRIEQAGLQVTIESFIDATGQTVSISKVVLSDKNKMACSRSFGDFEYKANTTLGDTEQAVIAVPDVIIQTRNEQLDQFLVLACDGVWDVMSSNDVGQFVSAAITKHLHDTTNVTKNGIVALPTIGDQLLAECFRLGSEDNLSCIVVALNGTDIEKMGLFQQQPKPNKPVAATAGFLSPPPSAVVAVTASTVTPTLTDTTESTTNLQVTPTDNVPTLHGKALDFSVPTES
jgi:serine/threonine protein phosphatase PrpC